STRICRSRPESVYSTISVSSPYHAKQPISPPVFSMFINAVQEQFLKHSSSHSFPLTLFSHHKAAFDVSGALTRATVKNPSPFGHDVDDLTCFLKQPSDPFLPFQLVGDLGSNPTKHSHSNRFKLSGLHLLLTPHSP
ncbi:hypothetical protein PanWU01x14_271340, partial [Parasponia andersonii]